MNLSINEKARQWLWFGGLWLAGFLAMGALAAVIRGFMKLLFT